MEFERTIAMMLRIGTILSAALLAIGILLLIANNGGGGSSLDQIINLAPQVNSASFSLANIFGGISGFDGISFIFLGFIVLIAIPISRVLLSIFMFLYQKNWLYVVITAIVFINLIVAILLIPSMIAGYG